MSVNGSLMFSKRALFHKKTHQHMNVVTTNAPSHVNTYGRFAVNYQCLIPMSAQITLLY